MPPEKAHSVDLPGQHAAALATLRTACEQHRGSDRGKTHALAVELLNDWEAIFQVLQHPALPLTNNDAATHCPDGTGSSSGKFATGNPHRGGFAESWRSLARRHRYLPPRGQSPWRYLRTHR